MSKLKFIQIIVKLITEKSIKRGKREINSQFRKKAIICIKEM